MRAGYYLGPQKYGLPTLGKPTLSQAAKPPLAFIHKDPDSKVLELGMNLIYNYKKWYTKMYWFTYECMKTNK